MKELENTGGMLPILPIVQQAEDVDCQELSAAEILDAELAEITWPTAELGRMLEGRYLASDGQVAAPPPVGVTVKTGLDRQAAARVGRETPMAEDRKARLEAARQALKAIPDGDRKAQNAAMRGVMGLPALEPEGGRGVDLGDHDQAAEASGGAGTGG